MCDLQRDKEGGGRSYRDTMVGRIGAEDKEEDEEMEMIEEEEDREGLRIEECKVGDYDCPAFILSKLEGKRIYRPWRRGVIVKLLGRRIGYKALQTRLKQTWVRKGIINIVDLGHDYYLVAFTHEDDQNTRK